MCYVSTISIFLISIYAEEPVAVKITDAISHIYTIDSGKMVKVHRIQDTANRLTDDFTKISRVCPPFCIQPTKVREGIQNIEELELLNFMKEDVVEGRGML